MNHHDPMADYAALVVATAPPLTDTQRDRIAVLLHGREVRRGNRAA